MTKKYRFIFILFAVLTAVALGGSIIALVQGFSGDTLFTAVRIADIVCILLTVFYTVVGYKKPHGNLLKSLLLIFAALMMLKVFNDATKGIAMTFILNMFAIICIAYVAGRLDRIEQNKYLMTFIALLIVACRVCLVIYAGSTEPMVNISQCTPVIVWLDICVAYFLRYKQHRKAGLEDAPKK